MGQLISKKPIVAVIGASVAEEPVCRVARDVGSAIAREGWHLVCGGGQGVMDAACTGFCDSRLDGSGIMAIGIIPGDDPDWANDHLDLVIPSGIGWARNAVITRTASAVVAIGGYSGTLSEIAFAWQMGRPIVAMTDAGGWAARLAGETLDPRRDDAIMRAGDADEAMNLLRPFLEKRDDDRR